MRFHHGERVQHRHWITGNGLPVTGTVHEFPDPETGTPAAEVRWDGSPVADELTSVEHDLVSLDDSERL